MSIPNAILEFNHHVPCQISNQECVCNNMPQLAYFSAYYMYYRIITIVQRDTMKYHEFVAEYCYECAARVAMP